MKSHKDPKLDLLQKIPLFSRCTEDELKEISSIADELAVPEGQEIMREGATGMEFVVIIEGTLGVTVHGKQRFELGPGDYVGEMALVTGHPRAATVVATSPVLAFVINHAAFHRLMRDIPTLAINVMQVLAQRLDAFDEVE